MSDWLLYGVLALLAGGVAALVYVIGKQNATKRKLDQVQRDLDQVQRDLDQANRILHGHELSEIEHKVLLMRIAGFKLDSIAKAISCDESSIDRYVSYLKEKGLL